jgi:hypothetical protein
VGLPVHHFRSTTFGSCLGPHLKGGENLLGLGLGVRPLRRWSVRAEDIVVVCPAMAPSGLAAPGVFPEVSRPKPKGSEPFRDGLAIRTLLNVSEESRDWESFKPPRGGFGGLYIYIFTSALSR